MRVISEGYRIEPGFFIGGPVTLDELVYDGSAPDLYQLSQDLFTALEFVYSESRWFADIGGQNVLCTTDGRFRLPVPNNTIPRTILPDTATFASNEYWMPVFAYLIGRVNLTALSPGEIPGILFNYLQVVFLVLRVRLALVDQEEKYASPALIEQLPIILDKLVPEYRALFTRLLTRSNKTPRPSDLEQIKALFIKKIILQTTEPEAPPVLPVIRWFECDKQNLYKDDIVEFSWEADFADSVVLFRNGVSHKEAEPGSNCIRLTDEYDDMVEAVSYSIYACNNHGYVSRQVLLKTGRRKPVSDRPLPLPAALFLAAALTLSVWLWPGR